MDSLNEIFSEPYFPYAFALVFIIPIIFLLRLFVFKYIEFKNREFKMLTVKGNAENKSQSYERMALFLERIKPSNLVSNFDAKLEKHEFLFLTEKSIIEEFNYNTSQQIYITKNTWSSVVMAKDEVIKLLQETYNKIGENANLEEYKTLLLLNYMNGEDYISQTIDELKREVLLVT
ncbi:DUF7935 family protein [Frigoriflavimonas asaccharolytica]|uniref:Uncharacterized protein n=1 Tax=Frigoriflavimonas asaccharolytica TaxID=2735899 RepID=A0A8J8K7H8_9FLAO|nr:hypothetical protein [Frigoriflavimonas asaccharolytica]NRS91501.1 hypothetical protein [Frigoriflavimonas asaccharolytica]